VRSNLSDSKATNLLKMGERNSKSVSTFKSTLLGIQKRNVIIKRKEMGWSGEGYERSFTQKSN